MSARLLIKRQFHHTVLWEIHEPLLMM